MGQEKLRGETPEREYLVNVKFRDVFAVMCPKISVSEQWVVNG